MTEELPRAASRCRWLPGLLLVLVPVSVIVACAVLIPMATASATGGCGGG